MLGSVAKQTWDWGLDSPGKVEADKHIDDRGVSSESITHTPITHWRCRREGRQAGKDMSKISRCLWQLKYRGVQLSLTGTTESCNLHLISLSRVHLEKKNVWVRTDKNLVLYRGKRRGTQATELLFFINMQIYLLRDFKNQIRTQPF